MTDPGPCIGETDKAGKVELLDCPFCNSEARALGPYGQDMLFRVECKGCYARMGGFDRCQQEAIDAWNTRVSVSRQECEPVAWLYEVFIGDGAWSQKYSDTKIEPKAWIRNIRPLYLAPPNVDDATQSGARDYVLRAIASFDRDPPDTQFQKGFLAALEIVRDEALALSPQKGRQDG